MAKRKHVYMHQRFGYDRLQGTDPNEEIYQNNIFPNSVQCYGDQLSGSQYVILVSQVAQNSQCSIVDRDSRIHIWPQPGWQLGTEEAAKFIT